MTEVPPPPSQPGGIVHAVIDAARNLTLTNILILALLAAILIPSYLLYVTVNDPAMMSRWLSSYEEITSDKSPCTIRIASLRGGGDEYGISTAFSAQGSDKWVISVLMDRKPSETEIQSYCQTLQLLVDHMQRPEETPSPNYPGTDQPLIWPYAQPESP